MLTVGHQEEHLAHPVPGGRDAWVHVADDVLVPAQIALEEGKWLFY